MIFLPYWPPLRHGQIENIMGMRDIKTSSIHLSDVFCALRLWLAAGGWSLQAFPVLAFLTSLNNKKKNAAASNIERGFVILFITFNFKSN